ncbi:hypothetical protein LCGC14_1668690 [marine sediment metagenome]|uniref:Uncharacterized protein n=1 Tax=marine sediment metagenome TaxID=412755 RepID=A0A0F9IEK5_9ZZZZ
MIDIKICTHRGTKTLVVVICANEESETYRYPQDADIAESVKESLVVWLRTG